MQGTAVFMIMLLCASHVFAQEDVPFDEEDLSNVVAEEGDAGPGSLPELDEIVSSAMAPEAVLSAERDAFDGSDLDVEDTEAVGSDMAVEEHMSGVENLDSDSASSRTLSGLMVIGASAAATVVAMAVV